MKKGKSFMCFFNLKKILVLGLCWWPLALSAESNKSALLRTLDYAGPAEKAYLAEAAGEALLGSLGRLGFVSKEAKASNSWERFFNSSRADLALTGKLSLVAGALRLRLLFQKKSSPRQEEYLSFTSEAGLLPALEVWVERNFATWEPPPEQKPARPIPAKPASQTKIWPRPALRPAAEPAKELSHATLPVKALSFAKIPGASQDFLVSTKRELFHYQKQGDLWRRQKVYQGGARDHFVRVDFWESAGQPWAVVTNVHASGVFSKILALEAGGFREVAKGLPYFFRVLSDGSLVGMPYSTTEQGLGKEIVFFQWEAGALKKTGSQNLPQATSLYTWVQDAKGDYWLMTASGRINHYRKEGSSYKKSSQSPEAYGVSANQVPYETKNFFNEVIAQHLVIPVGLEYWQGQVLTAQNHSRTKGVIGRVPWIRHSELLALQKSELAWEVRKLSKSLDGPVMDFLIEPGLAAAQMWVLLRSKAKSHVLALPLAP